MRLVSSPTSRLIATLVSSALAASVLMSTPARAASNPVAPGSFTGYGFDACVAPSQTVMDSWNLRSPFSAIGIYISGSSRYCGDKYQPNLSKSWVARNYANGWRFIPIHVGYQAPCFANNPKSRVQKKKMSSTTATARKQGAADAAEAVAALKKYGFGSGAYVYLDIEWYKRSTSCDNAVLEFSDAWTEHLHAKGFKSGLYSSGSAAIDAVDDARVAKRKGFTLPDQMWIAWTNKVANTDGGPYLRDDGWKHSRIHQYHNGVNMSYGGHTINIDKNWMDVGGGSRKTAESKPCSVAMSFSSYPALALGAKRAEVATLQCLLTKQGFAYGVNGAFGTGTAKAVDAFRTARGWTPTGHTTRPTWTALLSAGSTPRVLKQGSVGEPVWRLQRALTAAGAPVKITGLYDAATVEAVKKYRRANGLTEYSTTESSVWKLLQSGKTV